MPVIIVLIIFIILMAANANNESMLIFLAYLFSFILSAQLFILNFPAQYDLYRLYSLCETLQNYSFADLFHASERINIYMREMPAFIIYMWLIAQTHLIRLSVFIPGVAVYCFEVRMLSDYKKRYQCNNNSYLISVVTYFLMTDFVSITGIRNVFSYTCFFFLLYLELVENKNKLLIYALDLLLCLVHPTVLILFTVRLLVYLFKGFGAYLISIVIIGTLTLSAAVYEKYNGILYRIPVIRDVTWLYYKYVNNYTGGKIRSGAVLVSVLVYVFGLLLALKLLNEVKNDKKKLSIIKFGTIIFLFSLSVFHQYDLFVRLMYVCVPIISLMILIDYEEYEDDNLFKVRFTGESYASSFYSMLTYIMGMMAILLFVLYLFLFQYMPITRYFSL